MLMSENHPSSSMLDNCSIPKDFNEITTLLPTSVSKLELKRSPKEKITFETVAADHTCISSLTLALFVIRVMPKLHSVIFVIGRVSHFAVPDGSTDLMKISPWSVDGFKYTFEPVNEKLHADTLSTDTPVPPVMCTLLAFCVAIEPRPRF